MRIDAYATLPFSLLATAISVYVFASRGRAIGSKHSALAAPMLIALLLSGLGYTVLIAWGSFLQSRSSIDPFFVAVLPGIVCSALGFLAILGQDSKRKLLVVASSAIMLLLWFFLGLLLVLASGVV